MICRMKTAAESRINLNFAGTAFFERERQRNRETKKACDQNALDPSTCVCAQSHVQNCPSVPPTRNPKRQDRTPTADTCFVSRLQ